ncbi:hypothetical protein [Sphaerisporangium sp. NPDC051011]|uniref:hypothetical protein n=1 Tax=Sphaerisporangium sp. NPDC051011 TaxID=3155792 RepID=UPI0033EBE6B6
MFGGHLPVEPARPDGQHPAGESYDVVVQVKVSHDAIVALVSGARLRVATL